MIGAEDPFEPLRPEEDLSSRLEAEIVAEFERPCLEHKEASGCLSAGKTLKRGPNEACVLCRIRQRLFIADLATAESYQRRVIETGEQIRALEHFAYAHVADVDARPGRERIKFVVGSEIMKECVEEALSVAGAKGTIEYEVIEKNAFFRRFLKTSDAERREKAVLVEGLTREYRNLAEGFLVPECIVTSAVVPAFRLGNFLVGVFDDAGCLDYTAWVARGQECLKFFGEGDRLGIQDPIDGMDDAVRQKIEDALWAARERAKAAGR